LTLVISRAADGTETLTIDDGDDEEPPPTPVPLLDALWDRRGDAPAEPSAITNLLVLDPDRL
jgi:hypothetical protein